MTYNLFITFIWILLESTIVPNGSIFIEYSIMLGKRRILAFGKFSEYFIDIT